MGIEVKRLREVMTYVRKRGEDIRIKTMEVTEEIAECGRETAQRIYDEFEPNYDGGYDVNVTVEKTKNGYDVLAYGDDVMFVEFGTGVWNDKYPQAKWNALRGKYGKGYGDTGCPQSVAVQAKKAEDGSVGGRAYWYFTGDGSTNGTHAVKSKKNPIPKPYSFITHGNPPAKAMYEARKAMKQKFYELKREARNGKH